ncbi:hypothetical protein V6N13_074016 [Hibiscus sabdariffa]
MSEVHDGSCFLYVSGLWLIENWNCGMVATYASCRAVEQGACWRSLLVLISSCGLPVCCGGDFNSILSLEERRNCLGNRRGMAAFLDFVEEAGLLDLPT